MKQREISDESGAAWTCVQALAGVHSEAARRAERVVANENGEVPVICTPNGGAQSVRLRLPADWLESLSDAQLLYKILAATRS